MATISEITTLLQKAKAGQYIALKCNNNATDFSAKIVSIDPNNFGIIDSSKWSEGWEPTRNQCTWNFDVTKTSNMVAQVKLKDSSATWCSTLDLDAKSIQLLPNGNIQFAAARQGHAYTFGFESGHPLEISQLKSTYLCRLPTGVPQLHFAMFSNNGSFYYQQDNSTSLKQYQVSTPFDYTTIHDPVNITLRYIPQRAKFTSDGCHFFYANGSRGNEMSHRRLQIPWDLRSYSSSFETEQYISLPSSCPIQGFEVSPDGKQILAARRHTEGGWEAAITHFVMTNPGDLSTLTFKFRTILNNIAGYQYVIDFDNTSLCIDPTGTRMLYMYTLPNGDASTYIAEYHLSK